MKTRSKILYGIVLVTVVALAAGLLLAVDIAKVEEEEELFSTNNTIAASNMSAEVKTLTPNILFRYQFYETYPDIHNDYEPLVKKEITYHGTAMYMQFKVEWQEEISEEVKYKINVQKMVEGTYQDLPYEEVVEYEVKKQVQLVQNVGDYKVQVIIENPNYTLAPNSDYTFKITPYELEVKGILNTDFTYNSSPQRPNPEFKNPIGPAERPGYDPIGTGQLQWRNPSTNEYENIEQSINVGEYRIQYNFSNPNYIYINGPELANNVIEYKINPATIIVYPYLDTYTYDSLAKSVTIKDNETLGLYGKDKVNVSFKYLYSNSDINVKDKEVSEIKDAGIYTLKGISDNNNYVVKDNLVEVYRKEVIINYKAQDDLVYNGKAKGVTATILGLFLEDNIKIVATYNGKQEAPIDAGKYNITYSISGERKFNYEIIDNPIEMEILKAEYAIDDFEVEIHAIKVIVIKDNFEGISVRFSIDNKNWQEDSKIEALPMSEYTVYVKLLEDKNHNGKILTKQVKTGFDPVLFAENLDKVNIDDFSMKDVALVQKITSWKSYISEADKASVDFEKLEKVETAYANYKTSSQEVLNGAKQVANGFKMLYVVPATALAAGVCMLLRRNKNEK